MRVLTPGGRLLFNTWDILERNLFAAIVQSALGVLCPDDPPTFLSRIPYGYHDLDRIQRDVCAAGFGMPTCQTVAYDGQAPSVAALCTGFCQGTPLHAEITRRGDIGDITARATTILVDRYGTGALTGPLTAHVVTAQR